MTDYAELKARLSIKADMAQRGIPLQFQRVDSAIMREAAAAIDALERQWDEHDAAWSERVRLLTEQLQSADAKAKRLEEALQSLFALNDEYSPFGGEIYQDRVNRTWEHARAALPEDKSHE